MSAGPEPSADIQNGAVRDSAPSGRMPVLPDGWRWVAHLASDEVRVEIRPGRDREEDDHRRASMAWESESRSEVEIPVEQVVRMARELYARLEDSVDVSRQLGIEVNYR